jgi:hypothetical protein
MTAVQSMPALHSEFGVGSDHFSSHMAQGRPDMEQQSNTSASPGQDEARGRRRTREVDKGEDEQGDDQDNGGVGNSKKRRRSRKGLDKKFECPHEGCGKSYSRAEHLYRHQLNRMSYLFHPLRLSRCHSSVTPIPETSSYCELDDRSNEQVFVGIGEESE